MKYISLSAVFALLIINSTATAATAQDCKPPAIVFNAKSANLFTPEQEMILGDLAMQKSFSDMRYVNDEQLLSYVRAIGDRLVKHLPPTGLKFHFYIVDYPEANAFNIPGGHVFLTRKLIALARNEDEIAGVLAHELGHAAVHHGATDTSSLLRKILNVTSLGDRKDVTEKFNLLIERSRTKKISQKASHEDEQQVEADRIGLFAMVAAGYDSNATFTFFDRLTESKGKTGGWFSDLFGKTTAEQKRLREITRNVEQIPSGCRDRRSAGSSDAFLKWQAAVTFYRPEENRERLPGLVWKRDLGGKLRSDISRFVISPSGKYIVARDDFSLTVMEREPLKVVFQIQVANVDYYSIPNDEKSVVLLTSSLRFEKWSIAEQKPVEARELVLRRDCVENQLSPDGNYLACIDTSLSANIISVATGERVFQKKNFYELNWNEYWRWANSNFDSTLMPFFRIEFTPDSTIAIFSRSNHYRADTRRLSVASRYATYDTTLAVDVNTRKQVDVGGQLNTVFARAYLFLDGKRVLGMGSADAKESGIFSFPDGKRLSKFVFYANEIRPTGNPDYVVMKPLLHSKLGVFDLKTNQIILGLNHEDATVWKNHFIFESVAGRLVVREMTGAGKATDIDGPNVAILDLPASTIGGLRAAEVSNNFKWLVLSSSTRGGLWSLTDGELKLQVTGFRGGIVGEDGAAVAEFPKLEQETHSLVLLNPMTKNAGVIRELPDTGARQFGRFVLVKTSLDPKEAEVKKDEKKDGTRSESTGPTFDTGGVNLSENVRWELKDFVSEKVIWSRDFSAQAPSYSFDRFSGRLILYWFLGLEAGKTKLKQNPALAARAAQLGNKDSDYLIEVVDAFAGKELGSLFLETGKGSFYVGGGISEGDTLVLYDSEDRLLVYAISTGELKHRFFGKYAALSPARNQLAVENFPGQVTIFDLASGEPVGSVDIGGRAALIRFNLSGTQLFVLSDRQTAYVFDVKAATAPRPVP
ncbi:MAG TPA: M48 family metalloprotease [Pyrinomonadaceae bacterium]